MRNLLERYKGHKKGSDVEGDEAEGGFTLIELMVVLLIMAILLAIAIPTFLGLTSTAHQRGAQSNLTNALTSAKAVYASNQSYLTTAKMVPALNSGTPSISFTTGTAAAGNNVSVNVNTSGQSIVLVAKATTGSCWAVTDAAVATTAYAGKAGTFYASWKTAKCSAATANIAHAGWANIYPGSPGTAALS